MNKFILHTTIAFVLLFLVLQLIKSTVPFYWANDTLIRKMEILDRQQFPYNTYFIGSSRIYRHIIPQEFDSICGTHSFNLGASAMLATESLYFLRHFLQELEDTSSISIFTEKVDNNPNKISKKNLHTSRTNYCINYKIAKDAILYFWKTKNYIQVKYYALSYLENLFGIGELKDIYKFHTRILPIVNFESTNGYYGIDIEAKEKPSVGLLNDRKKYLRYLKRMKKQRRNGDILPTTNTLNLSLKQYDRLMHKLGFPQYYMYYLIDGSIELGPEFKYDRAHYNHKGARIITRELAKKYNALK